MACPPPSARSRCIPARATGLTDRGQIAAGLRADLVRIRMAQDLPVVREVYRGGQRVL